MWHYSKLLPAAAALVRSALPLVVRAYFGRLDGWEWGDYVAFISLTIMTFVAATFYVLVNLIGGINDATSLLNIAKQFKSLIDVTGPNERDQPQLFLSTRKDIDSFKNLFLAIIAYDEWNTRYHLFAIEVCMMVALGSLLVLSFVTVFGVELAEWNVTLMFDGFSVLVVCITVLSKFLGTRSCMTRGVVRALHGQKMAIDEFLVGHAGTSKEEEREEMRHAQLMIANLTTFIEDQPPETMFGMIKLNSQNVAKISATIGAVFASMVYERVREETIGDHSIG